MFYKIATGSIACLAVLSNSAVCRGEPFNDTSDSADEDTLDGGVPSEDEGSADGGMERAGETDEKEETAEEAEDWDDDWGDDATWEGDTGFDVAAAAAKVGVRVHGVFENQLQGMWLRDGDGGHEDMINDYTKLRVDLDADLAGDMVFRADGVVRVFAGDTEIALEHLIPARTLERLVAEDPRWSSFLDEPYRYENDYYLDNAYLKVPVGPLTVSVGKQPLSQGVGYAWNPTDVFTQKDMFDPTYEKPGIVALRAQAAIGERVTLDLVGVPRDDFKSWTGGGRVSVTAGPLRLSAVSYITRIESQDAAGSVDEMMAAALAGGGPEEGLLTYEGQRIMVGGEAVADIEGVRLWTEGAYNFVEDKEGLPDDYLEVVGGVEYFFKTETHVMIEYLHYGMGPKQQGGAYSYNDWMGVLAYHYKMLGRNFLFESVDHPVADFWTIGLSSFQSLSDASAAVMGDVKWQFREDAELWFLASYAVGEPEDFLSSARGQASLRLTAYF